MTTRSGRHVSTKGEHDATEPDSSAVTTTMVDLLAEGLPTQAYLYLLHNPGAGERELVAEGHDPDLLERTMRSLEAHGFVRRSPERGWFVLPPESALPSLAAQLEARAGTIRAALPGLIAAHRDAADRHGRNTGLVGLERLSGVGEVSLAMAECFAASRDHAKGMRVHSMSTREGTFTALPGARHGLVAVAGHRVAVETVIDTSLVADFAQADFVNFQDVPGVDVRVATGVPFTATVNDVGFAVIETYLDGRVDGFLVREPGLVAAVEATIDLMLRLSAPWRGQCQDGVDVITEQERIVLSLMAAGVPDATIARRVGISARTLDRRLRGLMDRLNATTRFQAGVNATARGWL